MVVVVVVVAALSLFSSIMHNIVVQLYRKDDYCKRWQSALSYRESLDDT